MIKLIVRNLKNVQEVIEVSESGGYFDESRVLWDERKHGSLPSETLAQIGGLSRDKDGKVIFDQVAFDAQKVKFDADDAAKIALKDEIRQAKSALKAIDFSQVTTIADVKNVLKTIRSVLKELL